MPNPPDPRDTAEFDPDVAGVVKEGLGEDGGPRESVAVHHERRISRVRRHWRFEVSDESEEWVISYMDMVTLIMCAFVVIAALLDLQSAHTAQPQTSGPRGTPPAEVAADMVQVVPPAVPTVGSGDAGGPDQPGDTAQGQSSPTGSTALSAATATAASTVLSGAMAQESTAEEKRFAEAWRKAVADQGLSEQVSITAKGRSVVMQIQDRILFASGRDEIGSGGLDVIRRLAPLLARTAGNIRVEGHTDNVPIDNERFASNWELSAGRASTVVHALIDAGIAPGRLSATGFADTRPEQSNDTESGRAHNRRVTLVIEN